jgi:dihydroxy-acid dehydratase
MAKKLRSAEWFNDPSDLSATAMYLERYMNFGLTREELQSGKPIIGIAQSGSDLSPCNRIHLDHAWRIREGIREAGGIAIEFPTHPIQETGKRPTAALDRNLAYLGLVEVLHGYPLDGVVLTTGCDKTTPAMLMAAATMDIPAIALNGGPMLDGHYNGRRVGSGTVLWEARTRYAAGEIGYEEFIEVVAASAPSMGHCNTMGTASTMNSLAEALGMSLPGSGNIPAPYRERGQVAYLTGKRAVEIVHDDLTPSKVMTRDAFLNAIAVNTAIGGSTNAPIHLAAIARHVGVELSLDDWQEVGYELPLLVNMQPAGEYLGEGFHQSGGVRAVIGELIGAGKIIESAMTINGKSIGENCRDRRSTNHEVIKPYDQPMKETAGFLVMRGNIFDSAIMKTSVIDDDFRARFLSEKGNENVFTGRAIVFEGPEDYHHNVNNPDLNMDEHCILFIRGTGPLGYPGSAEVVNMQPSDELIQRGIVSLPCIGDGRQSGTSGSPSILNASPESAAGGNLALLKAGDQVCIDLNKARVDMLVSDEEMAARRAAYVPPEFDNHTPWEEVYRSDVGQLETGGVLESAVKYQKVKNKIPRHSH